MVLVIKIGNRALSGTLSNEALSDLEQVYATNPTIIVHGGGDTVTEIAERLGLTQRFVTSPEGFKSRYTDGETIQVYTMVMAGRVNKEIVRTLARQKLPAFGLSGLDGGLIRAKRKTRLVAKTDDNRKRVIEGGYTGRITSVETSVLEMLLQSNYIPVIAPVAIGEDFEILNIDGDRAASAVAAATKADVLLFLTDVNGITISGAQIPRMNAEQAKTILPELGPGMITKTYAALEALAKGVSKVVIAPANVRQPFSSALGGMTGTEIGH